VRADNLFRFVVVRPPATEAVDESCSIEPPASIVDYAADLMAGAAFAANPLRAREEAGRTLIRSSYYTDNPQWQMVGRAQNRLLGLLAHALGQHDYADFVSATEGVLRDVIDGEPTISQWRSSEQFAEIEDMVWLSYLANVLASNERPGDRSRLVQWIQLLQLIKAASEGPESFERAVSTVGSCRPGVPADVFLAPQPEPVAAPEPGTESTEHIGEVDRKRRLYETALEQLARVEVVCRDRSANAESYRMAQEEEASEGREVRTGPSEVTSVPPPWIFSESDVVDFPELTRTLDDLGLNRSGVIHAARADIQGALAHVISELAAMTVTHELVGIGRTTMAIEGFGSLPAAEEREGY
jgi:hypothetical protein